MRPATPASRVIGRALQGALVALCLLALPAHALVMFDFDSGSSGPLPNGTRLQQGHDLGLATVFYDEVSAGGHLGATIFDTDPDGRNRHNAAAQDILVDLGNALIFQDLRYPEKVSENQFLWPTQSRYGGIVTFDFAESVSALSIDLIDIDADGMHAGNWEVVLIDLAGLSRTYVVPSGFSNERDYETLDLTRTTPQAGKNGRASNVHQDAGFDASRIGALRLVMRGSGAIDNLAFDTLVAQAPEPGAFVGLGMGLLVLAYYRRAPQRATLR